MPYQFFKQVTVTQINYMPKNTLIDYIMIVHYKLLTALIKNMFKTQKMIKYKQTIAFITLSKTFLITTKFIKQPLLKAMTT